MVDKKKKRRTMIIIIAVILLLLIGWQYFGKEAEKPVGLSVRIYDKFDNLIGSIRKTELISGEQRWYGADHIVFDTGVTNLGSVNLENVEMSLATPIELETAYKSAYGGIFPSQLNLPVAGSLVWTSGSVALTPFTPLAGLVENTQDFSVSVSSQAKDAYGVLQDPTTATDTLTLKFRADQCSDGTLIGDCSQITDYLGYKCQWKAVPSEGLELVAYGSPTCDCPGDRVWNGTACNWKGCLDGTAVYTCSASGQPDYCAFNTLTNTTSVVDNCGGTNDGLPLQDIHCGCEEINGVKPGDTGSDYYGNDIICEATGSCTYQDYTGLFSVALSWGQ